ncbi:MAG: gliding motility-associated C-terminal domain-containing protein [Cyclobacteriaceae bacterium]|nr:gliding motility-associated C-terminal domain-containing protein [Cyclobacteriaceae bacterium]
MARSIVFLIILLASFAGYSQVTSTFNTNAQGWTAPYANPGIVYNATGGNPGGYVSGNPYFFVLGAGTIYIPFYFVAPAAYKGNFTTYYNGTLRYDIQQSTTGAPNQYAEVRIKNTGGLNLYYFPATPNQPAAAPLWSTYSVVFNNSNGFWKTTNSATGPAASELQIQTILNSLDTLEIRGLYREANVNARMDNVTFSPPIVVTTQPTTTAVCNGVTATFTTVATGNPAITYRWQFETSPGVWSDLNNGGGYSNVTTASLSVNTTGNFGAGNYRCRLSGTAVVDAFTNAATLTINPLPTAPGATGAARCGTGTVTLTATGGVAGQYRWYTVPTGGTAIAGQTAATYVTPSLTVTTPYYVAINNGTCESTRTVVTATINTPPAAPTTTGASFCGTGSVTLSAAGGAAGQYRWYTVPSGGTAIAGQTNNTFITPALTITTTYYVAINNGTCESTRTAVVATINTIPGAPGGTGGSRCGSGTVVLSATGGVAGQYRWYTVPTGGTAIAGETNATYTTPALTSTTPYYVAINNGFCESTRTVVTATIEAIPTAPTVTGTTSCLPASVTLTAGGGTAGQYRWYTAATGGTAIAGEINNTFTTPVLTTSTTYYVAINNGTCESLRTAVTAAIALPGCDNIPPVVDNVPLVTQIGGIVTLNLLDLISDSDNNLDLSQLAIVPPAGRWASAFIDNSYNLIIDYTGIQFSGIDSISIRVCDIYTCVVQKFGIKVVGEINVYNALSPNNDGANDVFLIEHISVLDNTRENEVSIYNRWGALVWNGTNYNNDTIVFTGKSNSGNDLPSGTYFYKIEFKSGLKSESGYLVLKR